MSTFLGTADFDGAPAPASGPVSLGGQATYLGVMAFSNVDRATVDDLLPCGYRLAKRTTAREPDVHPVLLLFGDQTDGHYLLPAPSPNGIHYSELILAIPFVQRAGSFAWHNYVVRMYLDHEGATKAGVPYGYQKRLARIEWHGDIARVSALDTTPLFEGTFEWGGPWRDFVDAQANIPNFSDMVAIMRTRVLGHMFLGLCSQWEWDFTDARIAPATTSYDMITPFTVKMKDWPALSPFRSVPDGAVILRGLRWRLGPPPKTPC
jgi:hypothetical protein